MAFMTSELSEQYNFNKVSKYIKQFFENKVRSFYAVFVC